MRNISLLYASIIFTAFTAYFFALLFTIYPLLSGHLNWNPVLNWFVTGYFLFIPMLIYAVIAAKWEGRTTLTAIFSGLSIKPMSARDWKCAASGLAVVFALTGVIFGASLILNMYFDVRELSTTPWFVELSPLQGAERLLLVVWLGMFAFNIVGEEFLWRGYIQSRISTKRGWLVLSLLWWMFHLPFGIDLMIMLIPIVIVVPYVFQKTRNTLTCIVIHGAYNGPLFVAVALGAID